MFETLLAVLFVILLIAAFCLTGLYTFERFRQYATPVHLGLKAVVSVLLLLATAVLSHWLPIPLFAERPGVLMTVLPYEGMAVLLGVTTGLLATLAVERRPAFPSLLGQVLLD